MWIFFVSISVFILFSLPRISSISSLWKSHVHSRFSANDNCSMKPPSLQPPTRLLGFSLSIKGLKRITSGFPNPRYSGPLLSYLVGICDLTSFTLFEHVKFLRWDRGYTLLNQLHIVKDSNCFTNDKFTVLRNDFFKSRICLNIEMINVALQLSL